VYIIKGDGLRLKELQKSKFAQATEYIEPNYIYKIPKPGQVTWLGEYLQPEPDEAKPALKGPTTPCTASSGISIISTLSGRGTKLKAKALRSP